jgi:hypothetical protein
MIIKREGGGGLTALSQLSVKGQVPAIHELLRVLRRERVSQLLIPEFGQQPGLILCATCVTGESLVVGKLFVELEQSG